MRRGGQACNVMKLRGMRSIVRHKHWSEVLRIDAGVVTIPLFGIDVPTSSQCIWFHSELTGAESDHEIELGQELRPPGLTTGEQTDHGEVLKVLVGSNNVDQSFRTFEIVPPSGKRLKYSEEFFVVSVIIQFGDAQGAGMKSNRVDFAVSCDRGEDRCDSVV